MEQYFQTSLGKVAKKDLRDGEKKESLFLLCLDRSEALLLEGFFFCKSSQSKRRVEGGGGILDALRCSHERRSVKCVKVRKGAFLQDMVNIPKKFFFPSQTLTCSFLPCESFYTVNSLEEKEEKKGGRKGCL